MLIKKYPLLFIFLFAVSKLPAQLCKGSLGDPIINITFGAGNNPGPMLTTTKNLNYISDDCPNDGMYTVRNNTVNCFGNTWHTINGDHTGDANGYFMLINASLQKSEFYIDTLKGLCPSTTYEFAAWIMNVIRPTACNGNTIKPNLTFNIEKTDGTILQSYNSGDIVPTTSPQWNQYGFFFNTPAAVSDIVLRLLNNSTGGCGNDIAIDDITFRPCGPQLSPSIKGVPGSIKELCVGDDSTVTLQCDVSTGYNNPAYSWQQSKDGGNTWTGIPGETTTTLRRSFTATTPVGEYLYRLSVGEASNAGIAPCRVSSTVLTVRVNPNPVTSITSNSPVCKGNSINLSGSGGAAGAQYVWAGTNSFSAKGSATEIKNAQAANAGKYYLTITNANGCHHTDSTVITVNPAPVITTGFSAKTICRGESVLLSSSGGNSYKWSPATGLSSTVVSNPIAKPADSTVYTVVVTNEASCADSATVTINVMGKPIANAGPDKIIVEGQSVQLDGSITGGTGSITWFPPLFINDTHTLKPIVSPVFGTSYILTATSDNGCGSSSDTTNVKVYKKVVIPNAFSPNGDGVNDTWNITALTSYDNYELWVFNRYGEVVFSTKNYSQPWNGTLNGSPLPVGTYYYAIDLKGSLPKLTGYVVILR